MPNWGRVTKMSLRLNFFEQGIRQNIDDQLVYSNLFGVDITNETLEQSLKLLDKKINNFFLIISS